MNSKRWYNVAALVIIICGITYYNSLNTSFHFDDEGTVVENQAIRDLRDLITVVSYNASRPFLFLSFALNYHFGGLDPWGYHLINLLLHLLNTILVYLFVFSTLRLTVTENWCYHVALISALLFAAHPIQTETVSYISSRSSILCTSFYLLSIYFFLQGRMRNEGKTNFYFLISVLCFILAIGSKEIAVTLPVILLLYNYCFFSREEGKWQLQKLVVYHGPFWLILILLFYWRYYLYGTLGNPKFERELVVNLLTQLRVVVNYLRLLFFPLGLNVDPDFPLVTSLRVLPVIFSGVILAGIVVVGLSSLRRSPVYGFALFWFLITLLPTSSIVSLRDVMAEHRLYLPGIGFYILGGLALKRYLPNKLGLIAVMGVLLVFSLGTIGRNLVWKDELSLWQDVVRKSRFKNRPHYNLGREYGKMGLSKETIREYQESLKYEPKIYYAHNNLGVEYNNIGLHEEAINQFILALRFDPDLVSARIDLGGAYCKLGLFAQAEAELKKALRLDNNSSLAYYNLGLVYYKQRLWNQAKIEFEKARQLDSDSEKIHTNLGATYLQINLFNQAIKEYQEALRINQHNPETYNNLGVVYAKIGRWDKAILEYRKALELNPEFSLALLNQGKAYEKQGFLQKSKRELKEASAADPLLIQSLNHLGVFYKREGDYGKAIGILKKCIKIRDDFILAYYNLACIYSLQGRNDQSLTLLKRSIELGYRDFTWIMSDPDLANLRKTHDFETLISQTNIH